LNHSSILNRQWARMPVDIRWTIIYISKKI